jgi:hypothetical protein
MRLLAVVAAAAALLVFAAPALAAPVATDDGSYAVLGRVFPDPLAACSNSGGACSPYAQGNVPATQFIGIEEFLDAIKYMNQKPEWQRYMEILTLDGKLGDGAGNGKAPDIPGNNLDPEFTPKAEFVSAGIPTSDLSRKKSDMVVVRVTDESVPDAGKKRYALSLSIHGIERAGAEGGTRAMEDLVTAHTTETDGKPTAETPILPESVRKGAPTYGDALKKTIIYFTYPNPDGWRRGSVSSGPDGGVFFQRYNGNGVDPNRDWPDIGYAFRGYSAVSEPETRAWISFYSDVRNNGGKFSAGDDLHGQPFADALSYTLLPHGRHRYDKNQRIQEAAKGINANTYERIKWSPIVQANDQPRGGEVPCAPDTLGTACAKIYAQTWGSVYDTINYTTTGALGDWFDSAVGLNADGIDNEMSFSHLDKNINFDPHTEQLHVDGNKALIYAHLAQIIDPQYDDSFDVGGRKAYVPNKRVKRDAVKSQPDAPDGSVPQDQETIGPQPVNPAGSAFVFKNGVKFGPQPDGKNIFNGGMRVEVTNANLQGIGTGNVTLQVQCQHCDDHPGVKDSNEWVTVAEDYNQAPLVYAQAGVVATVNHPQAYDRDGKPVPWRALVAGEAGVSQVKVTFTKDRASEDGDTGGGAPPEQRPYDVANTDFFDDLNPFIPGKGQDLEKLSPRDVIDGKQSLDGFDSIALADDPLPGYVGPYNGVFEGPTGPVTPDFTFESQGSQSGLGSGAPGTYEEKEFEIGKNDSTKAVTVTVTWDDPNDDFDLSIDRVNEDGSRSQVDSDGNGAPSTKEQVSIPDPAPGKYVIVVDNFAAQSDVWKGTAKFDALPARPATSDFTEAEKNTWFKKLGDWVKDGGNLVLTDGALRALPELSTVPGSAISRQVVYAGQSAFTTGEGDTLKDPLARDVVQPGARFNDGMRRQMFEPTPLGFAIQDLGGNDESNARQFQVARGEWEKAGGRTVATSADSETRSAAAVTEQVTIGELGVGKGRLRIAGALLPQPTEAFDHQFGLEPYATTYTGYTMARNLLEALNRSKNVVAGGSTVGGRFVISRRAVKLRGGFARVRVSCRTPLGCTGTLRLAVKVKKGKGKGKKAKLVRIGTKKFKFATKHRNAVLKVKVTKKGRRIVGSQKRRIKTHATAPVKFRDGLKGTAKRTFWLYRPSHKKRHK